MLGSPPGRVSSPDNVVNHASSSAKSDVFDSDSPYSALLDSEDEDDSFVKKSCLDDGFIKKSCLPKHEDEFYSDLQPNSGNFGFPVQDQGTWFWQY